MKSDRSGSEEEYDKRPTWSMIKRTSVFIKPFRWTFISSILLVILGTLFKAAQPVLMKIIIDDVFTSKDTTALKETGFMYLGTIILYFLLFGLATVLIGRAGVFIVNNIKRDLFDHILSLGLSWVEKIPVGSMVSRIESDSQRLTNFCSVMMLSVVQSFLIIVFALVGIYMYSESLSLFMVSVISLPIVLVIIVYMFQKLRPRYFEERRRYGQLSGHVSEMVSSVPLLQSLDRMSWAEERVQKENKSFIDFVIKIYVTQYGIFSGLHLLEGLAIVIALLIGIVEVQLGVQEGGITPGTLVMFIQYTVMINQPIAMLSEQLAEMQRAGGAADRIFKTLDEKASVTEPETLVSDIPGGQELAFDNVSFSYDGQKKVIKNFSLTIEAGKTVALVGKTGCGKSTLLSLLLHLREVDEGMIRYGDVDIRHYEGKAYRRLFGMVLQDLHLFPASVEDNLKVFRDDIPREQVEKAVKLVGAEELVASFDRGLDTLLEEGGKNLSYGERQLLSFARALTVDPEILLLDEATSSVDPGTEFKLQQMLDTLTGDRTTVIVAHRLSTIRQADKIVVIEDGEIKEEGQHDELMARQGQYFDYVMRQQSQGEDL